MPDKISILKESGETINSNVVSVFMIPDTEKKYIITTENAVDPHGLTVLHVSEIVDGVLQKIATDEEWSTIKTIMRAMISGSVSSYQYFPTIESIKANGQYSRDISVSASASKQMIDNYMAAEKSGIIVPPQSNNLQNQTNNINQQSVAPQNNQSVTIFPTNGVSSMNADDELIPGIAEVNATPVDPSALQNSAVNNGGINAVNAVPPVGGANNVDNTSQVNMGAGVINNVGNPMMQNIVNPTPTVEPVMQPNMMSNNMMPTGNVPPVNSADVSQMNNNVQTIMNPSVPSNDINNPVLNNDVQVPNTLIMPPLTDNVNTMTASNNQVNNGIISPTPVIVTESVEDKKIGVVSTEPIINTQSTPIPETNNVQVLQPSVTVPTAQIANEAQEAPVVKIDTNASPSFNPDASLDEVVMAAQEMFMEGVKNLVQTIQEKVYRDLYAREAQVKEKEALLEQREKVLNDQMMAMMSNFAVMQGKPLSTAMSQPTVVETNNDVK
ncbi:MAG: hypothetical protein ACI4XM_02705 [Candidatus Coprovivens sp.]